MDTTVIQGIDKDCLKIGCQDFLILEYDLNQNNHVSEKNSNYHIPILSFYFIGFSGHLHLEERREKNNMILVYNCVELNNSPNF